MNHAERIRRGSNPRGNKELLPSVDTGRQQEMHLSEILSPGFFPQGLVFLCVRACVCVRTQTHKHT